MAIDLAEPLLGGLYTLYVDALGASAAWWVGHITLVAGGCTVLLVNRQLERNLVWLRTDRYTTCCLPRSDWNDRCTSDGVSGILPLPSFRRIHYCRLNQCLHLVAVVSNGTTKGLNPTHS